jgi:hypothetical protein
MPKAAAKPAAKVDTATVAPKVEKAPRDVQNNIARPGTGTVTGTIWSIADSLSAALGSPVGRKEVLDEAAKKEINPSTAATQYGRWRKYNGLTGRGTEADAK